MSPEESHLREIIVWENVNNLLWQKLESVHYDRVRDTLFDQLENNYDDMRKNRHPEDETLFLCPICLPAGNFWHLFNFIVDDTMADTHLFVVGVDHEMGRIGIR